VHGVAQARVHGLQNFAAEGVERDILRSGQKSEQRGKPQDGPDAFPGFRPPSEADGEQQADLREQHPAAPAAEAGTLKRSSSGDQRNFQV
jgi:hypothetical protein